MMNQEILISGNHSQNYHIYKNLQRKSISLEKSLADVILIQNKLQLYKLFTENELLKKKKQEQSEEIARLQSQYQKMLKQFSNENESYNELKLDYEAQIDSLKEQLQMIQMQRMKEKQHFERDIDELSKKLMSYKDKKSNYADNERLQRQIEVLLSQVQKFFQQNAKLKKEVEKYRGFYEEDQNKRNLIIQQKKNLDDQQEKLFKIKNNYNELKNKLEKIDSQKINNLDQFLLNRSPVNQSVDYYYRTPKTRRIQKRSRFDLAQVLKTDSEDPHYQLMSELEFKQLILVEQQRLQRNGKFDMKQNQSCEPVSSRSDLQQSFEFALTSKKL